MIPKYENLIKAKGKQFTAKHLKQPTGSEKKELTSVSYGWMKGLTLDPTGTSDQGMFIFYVQKDASYGFVDAGVNWACSGPYSGCKFQIGKYDGRIYVAHISIESGVDHSSDLLKYLPDAKAEFDYTTSMTDVDPKKMPKNVFNVSKYLFAWWAGDLTNLSVTELTVAGLGMDAGKIINVTKI